MKLSSKWKMGILLLSLITVGAVSSGCDQGDDRLKEKAVIEGQESAKSQVKAENENKTVWASQMQADLLRRRRFINALSGKYEGTYIYSDGKVGFVRFIFAPSLPEYPKADRYKTLEELTYELNNLFFSVQVVEWSFVGEGKNRSEVAFGRVYEHVRPDIVEGKVILMSDQSKFSYVLYLSDLLSKEAAPKSEELQKRQSKSIAKHIVDGKVRFSERLVGVRQSNLTSREFSVQLEKVNRD